MADILLSSEAFIKANTSVSDNLDGKYILPALREAQEQGLRGILGDTLLDKLKQLQGAGALSGAYKTLVDRCQYYLAYMTLVELSTKVTYKIGNMGVVKSSDENMQVASQEEINNVQFVYQAKADSYCLDIQHFLLEHRSDYPELSSNQCYKIQSNLYSAATCGLVLGGARGKSVRNRRGGR